MSRQRIEIVIDGMNLARSKESDVPWIPVDDAAAVVQAATFFSSRGADSVKVIPTKEPSRHKDHCR